MKIHEYQAKELLRRYGVSVPQGRAALSLAEAEEAIDWLAREKGLPLVVKAQIHAGGRAYRGPRVWRWECEWVPVWIIELPA